MKAAWKLKICCFCFPLKRPASSASGFAAASTSLNYTVKIYNFGTSKWSNWPPGLQSPPSSLWGLNARKHLAYVLFLWFGASWSEVEKVLEPGNWVLRIFFWLAESCCDQVANLNIPFWQTTFSFLPQIFVGRNSILQNILWIESKIFLQEIHKIIQKMLFCLI